ncbi:adenosylcobinamide-GDP ribazoletransferase [Aliikangiella marina]|uniref:Adenosylcobinamide-GDP ribazoletransferase n=1 Tax=Aliikangiella marina TaxID=1712262 RepID=A0A545TCP6_9GAMM|nr:adenosylcobinamide-GDP ribazoletransferase [Aliikangiella marina]TQV74992.1 adenosylcobinamide-GDP ribazoletransferase [Aliikangiella marina]
MTLIRTELNLVMIALTFLTRIPSPILINFSQSSLNQASRYFPLIGFLVGIITAGIYWVFAKFLPSDIAIVISMIMSLLLTGGFHEDGLADTCDGLGGGFERSHKLSIMKDSRIGTYGALAVWSVLTLKFLLLSHMQEVVIALLVAHPLSRTVSTMMIPLLPYVQDAEQSKSKPLAESQNHLDWVIALLIGSLSLLMVSHLAVALVVVLSILMVIARAFLLRQIGGFTGDTLGGLQQVAEIIIYLVIIAGSTSI